MATSPEMKRLYEAGSHTFSRPIRIAFPNLFTPRGFSRTPNLNEVLKYDTALFLPADHPDVPAIKAILVTVASMQWPDRAIEWRNPMAFHNPVAIGNEEADRAKRDGKDVEFYRGHLVIRGRSKNPPNLAVLRAGKIVSYNDPTMRPQAVEFFYSGANVSAQVCFMPYKGIHPAPDGITCYLNMLLATGGGDKLAGGRDPTEVFRGYQGHVSAVSPTGAPAAADIGF